MSVTEQLMALEAERCRCVVEQNYQRLGDLLSRSLIHTHTRGNVDTRESYGHSAQTQGKPDTQDDADRRACWP
jgi:hypothetical protein